MQITPPHATRAAAAATTALAWYALPDVLRSRSARIVAKVALLAGFATLVVVTEPPEEPDHTDLFEMTDAPATPHWPLLAGGAALLVASTAASVAVERKVFARGELRRAQGRRLAHTRTGIAAGLLAGASVLLDGH